MSFLTLEICFTTRSYVLLQDLKIVSETKKYFNFTWYLFLQLVRIHLVLGFFANCTVTSVSHLIAQWQQLYRETVLQRVIYALRRKEVKNWLQCNYYIKAKLRWFWSEVAITNYNSPIGFEKIPYNKNFQLTCVTMVLARLHVVDLLRKKAFYLIINFYVL